jgi:uncharacterized protein (DUF952 family)
MAHLKDKYEYWDVDATPPGLEVLWKIVSPADLAKWQEAGGISGSELDRKDGFIHTSNGRMVREVAARFFKGVGDAVLLKMLPEEWPLAVIWSPDEPVGVLKRPVTGSVSVHWLPDGCAHVYHSYPLPLECVAETHPMPLGADGVHVFPEGMEDKPVDMTPGPEVHPAHGGPGPGGAGPGDGDAMET